MRQLKQVIAVILFAIGGFYGLGTMGYLYSPPADAPGVWVLTGLIAGAALFGGSWFWPGEAASKPEESEKPKREYPPIGIKHR